MTIPPAVFLTPTAPAPAATKAVAMSELITADEAQRLESAEQVIAEGLQTFVEVGQALTAIRDERLYRAEYGTFEAYCSERWQISRFYAHRLIEAAGVVLPIVNMGLPAPANEGQARELAKVPEPERAEVWQRVITETDGKPTAAAIREAASPTPTPVPQPPVASLPESTESQEVQEVFTGAVLARAHERTPEEQARIDHAHHLRTSDTVRKTVNECVISLSSPSLQAEYAEHYIPDPRSGYVEVTAEKIREAADALNEFAKVWEKHHDR